MKTINLSITINNYLKTKSQINIFFYNKINKVITAKFQHHINKYLKMNIITSSLIDKPIFFLIIPIINIKIHKMLIKICLMIITKINLSNSNMKIR